MIKDKILSRLIGKILFVGLLISTVPATLPLEAQPLPKLSKAEIAEEIKDIKKTVRQLKIATLVVPGMIIVAGVIIALATFGLMLYFKKIKPKKIESTVSLAKETIEELKKNIRGLSHPNPELVETLRDQFVEAEKKIIKGPAQLAKAEKRRTLSKFVAVAATVVTPIAAFLTAIGLAGETLVEAFDRAEQLEIMEKKHPGTLTKKQKLVIARLKRMYLEPVPRGIIKYFALKVALKKSANTALQKNPNLIKTMGRGNKKRARKIVKRYIKLKWNANILQSSVNEIEKQTPTDITKWSRKYKKARKKLKKMQTSLTDQEKKYPSLKNLDKIIEAYGEKVQNTLEEFTKPVLKPEKEEPIIVPL